MSIKDIITKYGGNSDTIWIVVGTLSDYLEEKLSADDYTALCKKLFCILADGHYDKDFADEQIAKLYYEDGDGQKHYAPYWTADEVADFYERNKDMIPDEYNLYDFAVTLNMIKSDYYGIVESWFAGEDTEKRYVELAVNWLNDDDNPFGKEKVWRYFNS